MLSILIRHCKADRLFGAGLRNHNDIDAIITHCREDSAGYSGNPYHPGTFNRNQTDVINSCKSFYRICDRVTDIGMIDLSNLGSGGTLVEEISDQDGNAVLHSGQCSTGMHDIGAKIAQLPCLIVRQFLKTHGLRNFAGIWTYTTDKVVREKFTGRATQRN